MGTLDPQVDVVIAVHSPDRPVARAVASILRHTIASVRVTVVCHGIGSDEIAVGLSEFTDDERLRLVEFSDGLPSPSGPFNTGLDAATASFTAIMGSDDELAPGAIDSWLRVQARDHAAVVIPRLVHASGVGVATPPVRPFHSQNLDGLRDRLLYRSAPLGLISREVFGELRLEKGLRAGGDIAFSAKLWLSREPISFDLSGPPYLIHDDARDRVTFSIRPVAEELRFLPELLAKGWIARLPVAEKTALAIKLFRIHLFGAVFNRREFAHWVPADRADLRAAAASVVSFAPGCLRHLSRADRDVVDAMLDPEQFGTERLIELAHIRRQFGKPSTMFPREIRNFLSREAPFRMMVASWIIRRRSSQSRS